MSYNDDRPGMMRIHIAAQRADAICQAFTRHQIRELAKRHGVSTAYNKLTMAWFLAANHGVIAPGYDKAAER